MCGSCGLDLHEVFIATLSEWIVDTIEGRDACGPTVVVWVELLAIYHGTPFFQRIREKIASTTRWAPTIQL